MADKLQQCMQGVASLLISWGEGICSGFIFYFVVSQIKSVVEYFSIQIENSPEIMSFLIGQSK